MKSILLICTLLICAIGQAQTFSTSTAINIVETNVEYCSPITVTGLTQNLNCGTPMALRSVCIRIDHTFTSDLDIYLKSPNGTSVELTTDNGSLGDNYGQGATSTCFNMASTSNVTAGAAPFIAGPYLPEGNLNTFNTNVSGNGAWNLCVTDDSGGDTGTLISWSLEFGAPLGSPCATTTTNPVDPGTSTSAPIIPTACATATYNIPINALVKFYDDGGPGGNPCSETTVANGNFCNCGCQTITTICAPTGGFIIADFLEMAMFNTNSAFDWMVIYDGPTTSGTILFDNRVGGPNNVLGDCGKGPGYLGFCSTSRCLTFQFYASSVVNRAGWDANVYSTTVQCVVPLSIDLADFSIDCNETSRLVRWTTASEKNTDYFVVQFSSDGLAWADVAKVNANGTSNKVQNYNVRDLKSKGNGYYRLVEYELNGTNHVADMRYSECTSSFENSVTVFPNPVTNELSIQIESAEILGSSKIRIVDMNGIEVFSDQIQVDMMVQSFNFDKMKLANGTYLLHVEAANFALKPLRFIVIND